MSFSEILVVLIIGVLVLSPEDLKVLVKNFYQLRKYLSSLKDQILAPIKSELDNLEENICQEKDEINFYLEKIASLNHKYEGDYSLDQIKRHYYKLLGKLKS